MRKGGIAHELLLPHRLLQGVSFSCRSLVVSTLQRPPISCVLYLVFFSFRNIIHISAPYHIFRWNPIANMNERRHQLLPMLIIVLHSMLMLRPAVGDSIPKSGHHHDKTARLERRVDESTAATQLKTNYREYSKLCEAGSDLSHPCFTHWGRRPSRMSRSPSTTRSSTQSRRFW